MNQVATGAVGVSRSVRRPTCQRCLKHKARNELRHFNPDTGRWEDLPACKACLSNGRKAV